MGWPELAVCALVGFFVFGPERLPGVARDAARAVARLRVMAQGVTDELKEQLPEKGSLGLEELRELRELRELHPKRIVRSAFADSDRSEARSEPVTPSTGGVDSATVAATATPVARTLGALGGATASTQLVPPYDVDAT
jgi:sec-independent protein translocase protein TatB